MTPQEFLPGALAAARKLANRRIYRVLTALVSGVRVESNEAAKTARIGIAGSCVVRVEVSPTFLRRCVRSDQDALFLLLHELMHRLRGDLEWRLPDEDVSHDAVNVVLDLLANAHLLRLAFPDPPALLGRVYSADRFPWNLLLPPTLMARQCRRHDARWETYDRPHDVLSRLYASKHVSRFRLVTLVEEQFRRSGAPDPARLAGLYLKGWLVDMPRLACLHEVAPLLSREFPSLRALLKKVLVLGDHDSAETLEGVREELGLGRRAGWRAQLDEGSLGRVEAAEDRAFFEAVRQAVCRDDRQPVSRSGAVPSASVAGDVGRREAIFLANGVAPPFYRSTVPGREESHERVHVYLDVSGSTADYQRLFFGLTLRLGERIGSPVYQFSNQVVPVTLGELLEGQLRTTRGTDFDCVVGHALERDFSRILVVTDGEGGLDDALRARAERRGLQVFAVLTSAFPRDSPIVRISRQWWALPEGMRGRRRRWIAVTQSCPRACRSRAGRRPAGLERVAVHCRGAAELP